MFPKTKPLKYNNICVNKFFSHFCYESSPKKKNKFDRKLIIKFKEFVLKNVS